MLLIFDFRVITTNEWYVDEQKEYRFYNRFPNGNLKHNV